VEIQGARLGRRPGQRLAIENWKTGLARYIAYCEANGIKPRDLTSFN
jgi:hypothetical protein